MVLPTAFPALLTQVAPLFSRGTRHVNGTPSASAPAESAKIKMYIINIHMEINFLNMSLDFLNSPGYTLWCPRALASSHSSPGHEPTHDREE